MTPSLQPRNALARTGRLFRPGLRCSFRGRSADEVERLVAGASAHICDACIDECVAVLDEHGGTAPRAPTQ
ncbi:MAG: ClpX C4-type zinc finger protein [Xanthobacteraceae bacterium]